MKRASPGELGRIDGDVNQFGRPGEKTTSDAYLADQREVTNRDAGKEISGTVDIALPPGKYHVRFYSPVEGTYTDGPGINGGPTFPLSIPAFHQDLVIRAQHVD